MLRSEPTSERARGAMQPRAVAAVALAVVLWGASSVAIKSVAASGIVVAFYRLWFAIPLLWMLPLIRPEMRRRMSRRWLIACLAGGSLFFLHQVLFFSALKLTTVANVTIIGALQPGVVLLLAGPLFGERATPAGILWTGVAFAGTSLVVLGARGISAWSLEGDAMAFANLFAFSAYFLASKHLRSSVEAWDYVVGMTTVSGLWMFLTALATGQDLASPQAGDWLLLLAIAALPGTLGHFLINWAHAHASALSLSVLLLAVPVVAAIGAAAFLDEQLAGLQMLGGLTALLAIAAVVRSTPPATGDQLAQSAAETDAP